jgi:glycyl-tRNA synthetase beta chain
MSDCVPNNAVTVELGFEELPADLLPWLLSQWQTAVKGVLQGFGLEASQHTPQFWATPRRMACGLGQLPASLPSTTEHLKGPAWRAALTAAGEASPALKGFLAKQGIADAQAWLADNPAPAEPNAYVELTRTVAGAEVATVLPQALADALLAQKGPRFMRWGNHSLQTSRPLQWVLALWNDEIAPVSIALDETHALKADRLTYGHRVLGEVAGQAIAVPTATAYANVLRQHGHVEPDHLLRVEAIEAQLAEVAQHLGGVALTSPEFNAMLAYLVEAPKVVVGRFDEAYLAMPPAVLMTVMKAHQKYVPVGVAGMPPHADAPQLLPAFLCVSNNPRPEAEANIIAGNQRVLKARLHDAAFFDTEDMKLSLAERLPKLQGVTFQRGLGSLWDKTQRLQALCLTLASLCSLSEQQATHLERAAQLSKTDLVTAMVFEFTELQGLVGANYALRQGEHPDVAQALAHQYIPRYAGDPAPTATVSQLLSLADKVDTLVGVCSRPKAKLPTGSSDPMGLRRVMTGLLSLYAEAGVSVDLLAVAQAAHALQPDPKQSWEDTQPLLALFLRQRLITLFKEQGLPHETGDALLEGQPLLADLPALLQRLQRLRGLLAIPRPRPDETVTHPVQSLNVLALRVERMLGAEATNALHCPNVLSELLANQPAQWPTQYESSFAQALQAVVALGLTTTAEATTAQLTSNAAPYLALCHASNALFDNVMINDPALPAEALAQRRKLLLACHVALALRFGRLSCFNLAARTRLELKASPVAVG